MDSETKRKYGDIIDMPHHQSINFKRMSMVERGAQFSPFAALVGHGDAIKETARCTDEFIELSEGEKCIINEKLLILLDNIKIKPRITVTYFKPDEKKAGGKYETICETLEKYINLTNSIKFSNGVVVEVSRIVSINCDELFKYYNL